MKTQQTRDLVPLETLTDAAARKRYWRSLEELSDWPEFQDLLHTEFPPNATEFLDEVSRRRFLQLAAASLGLAGLTACTRQPPDKILPYVNPPENAIPGHPLYFATAVPVAGIAEGVLVETHLGRPTKIEGNGDHYSDETSVECQWQVPETHLLEDWGDTRAFDGTVTIQQPLILPLYDSTSSLRLLDSILTPPGRSSYEIVQTYWQKKSGANDFQHWWRKSVHDGMVADSALPPLLPQLKTGWAQSLGSLAQQGIELVFRPDPYLYDGRYAKLQGKMKSSRFQTSADCKGNSEVSGSAYGNYLHLEGSPVSGSCQLTERGKTTEVSAKDSDTSFRCEFQNVDTVNGGEYEVHANGEESQWATCRLELKPQQR